MIVEHMIRLNFSCHQVSNLRGLVMTTVHVASQKISSIVYWISHTIFHRLCFAHHEVSVLRVEEDKNIADLSPYDKYKQNSSQIRL